MNNTIRSSPQINPEIRYDNATTSHHIVHLRVKEDESIKGLIMIINNNVWLLLI